MRRHLKIGWPLLLIATIAGAVGCQEPTEEDYERLMTSGPFPPCGGVEKIQSARVAYDSDGSSMAVKLRSTPSTSSNAPIVALLESGMALTVNGTATSVDWPFQWFSVKLVSDPSKAGYVAAFLVQTTCIGGVTPVPAGKKTLYLTFDDGPSSYTDQVLDLLKQYSAKATFFLLGQQVKALPAGHESDPQAGDLRVRRQLAEGHAIANHTWDHTSLQGMSSSKFVEEVQWTEGVLQPYGALAKNKTHCLRPPYGATDTTTASKARALGYTLVLWSVDPRDWARPGVDAITTNILGNVRDGAIVLMHDGGGDRTQTVSALRGVLASLKDTYQFLALPDCH
jgi:peptidoglycan-N-acetylglucosamine deacetylase